MKLITILLSILITQFIVAAPAIAADKKNPLAHWKPKFDPNGAEHTYILSNVTHPVVEGAAVGYRIRDRVWEESKGKLYVDFRPLSQLGGEKDVISKLKMGAIHGMMSSSVAAANIAGPLGVVNLPYVVDTFDKLDKFRNTPELWQPFASSTERSGLMVVDITGYGPYGWATNTPVQNLEDAKKINFRIAQAPVNIDSYKDWGLKFTVMPWPDVPQALQTGVITGLDHTAIICNITKKFTIAKNFTELNYAQGLFIHLINKRWLNKLPKDLQNILITVIEEESADTRERTKQQHKEQVTAAKESGVAFYQLTDNERATLIKQAQPVYEKWGDRVGADYLKKVQSTL